MVAPGFSSIDSKVRSISQGSIIHAASENQECMRLQPKKSQRFVELTIFFP